MNKEEFNNLELIEQINYVNEQLKQGLSLTSVSKVVGVDRGTIGNRAIKVGYEFNKELKQYIEVKEVIEKELPSNNYEGNNEVVYSENEGSNEDIKDLKQKVNELYDWYSSIKTSKELIINNFEGEPINRTFKIYSDVQEQFKNFCEEYKDKYKVQDIVTQALFEFMGKYK